MCIDKATNTFLECIINLLLSYHLTNFLILGTKFNDRFACVTGSLVKYVNVFHKRVAHTSESPTQASRPHKRVAHQNTRT